MCRQFAIAGGFGAGPEGFALLHCALNRTSGHYVEHPFESLDGLLKRWNANLGASELHGNVCGWLCGGTETGIDRWQTRLGLEQAFGSGSSDEAERVLDALARVSWSQLENESFDFQLILPPDSEPMQRRTDALLSWCAGFLGGLGLAGYRPPGDDEGCAEFLDDLGRIARSEIEMRDDPEEDEAAYAELVEFLRMGALMVHLSHNRQAA